MIVYVQMMSVKRAMSGECDDAMSGQSDNKSRLSYLSKPWYNCQAAILTLCALQGEEFPFRGLARGLAMRIG